MINLYNRDCLEAMREMADNSFDLAIVDPPYGIGASSAKFMRTGTQTGNSKAIAGLYKSSQWDNNIPSPEYFKELMRVSKNQIIWGGNYFIDHLYNSSCFVVWDKINGDNRYSDCELAWTSFKTGVRLFSYMWNGMLQEDMRNKEKRIHPTQKPTALYRWLLDKYAKKGDKILDTHLGSGSIAIACHEMKFDLTAFELDPDYFEMASKRLEAHQRQLTLF